MLLLIHKLRTDMYGMQKALMKRARDGMHNDIMEKRCHEALCIHVHTSKNTRHREGVSDVRLSAAAGLPVVGLFRVIVSTPDLLRLVQRQVVCNQLLKSGE